MKPHIVEDLVTVFSDIHRADFPLYILMKIFAEKIFITKKPAIYRDLED
jgi:hypothetical protein